MLEEFPQQTPSTDIHEFGQLSDGRRVQRVVLSNGLGMEVELLSYGAMIHRIKTEDSSGEVADVALFCESLEDYVTQTAYLGSTVGRYANRIANSSFMLEGEKIQLIPNEGENQLHGGADGLSHRVWEVECGVEEEQSFARFHFVSEDGDQGFPGELEVTVEYCLNSHNALQVEFKAVSSKTTIVNLTNHVYLNLSGDVFSGLSSHQFRIASNRVTQVDERCMPNGEIMDVSGGSLDLREAQSIADSLLNLPEDLKPTKGFDHNYVFDNTGVFTERAEITHTESGRALTILATHPGAQFYTGNHLRWGNAKGPGGKYYEDFGGFCVEPQHYPDSPNHSNFPSPALEAGDTYRQSIVYQFGVCDTP